MAPSPVVRGNDRQLPRWLQWLSLFGFLYLFFVAISLFGESLKLLGRDTASELLASVGNPYIGLFVGILATSIVQSSSSVTSITVGLVAGGGLPVEHAIPIIIGSNMGTSVTNALVAAGQLSRRDEFEKAFAAAVVDDFFEICSILLLFPLQLHFDLLGRTASFLSRQFAAAGGFRAFDPVEAAIAPAVELVVWLGRGSPLVVLLVALVMLFGALRSLVRALKRLLIGKIERFIDETLFKNAGRAMAIGFAATALIQSSSLTTSLVVPLAGAGFLALHQVFPYALGANVGTTLTAILAALVTGQEAALTVGFAHLVYNLFGIALLWPVRMIPMGLARLLAKYSVRSRLVPLAFVLLVFFALPLTVIYVAR